MEHLLGREVRNLGSKLIEEGTSVLEDVTRVVVGRLGPKRAEIADERILDDWRQFSHSVVRAHAAAFSPDRAAMEDHGELRDRGSNLGGGGVSAAIDTAPCPQ